MYAVLNLLVRLFHGLMIFMPVEYLNCTNYSFSEFLLRLVGEISLSFCHWNLNGINARDRIKVPLIETYSSVMHFDLLALSETFLDTSAEEEKLFIQGFSKEIWRRDHLRDTKQGGVCLYFKEDLPIKHRTDLEIMDETTVTVISIKRKKIIFVVIY